MAILHTIVVAMFVGAQLLGDALLAVRREAGMILLSPARRMLNHDQTNFLKQAQDLLRGGDLCEQDGAAARS